MRYANWQQTNTAPDLAECVNLGGAVDHEAGALKEIFVNLTTLHAWVRVRIPTEVRWYTANLTENA